MSRSKSTTPSQKRLVAFPYFGGKNWHLSWLLEHVGHEADVYVEPYCGSAALALNRPRARVEVLGDLYGDLVNYFRVCRDDPDHLAALLSLTPYAEEEFRDCFSPSPDADDVERARRFIVRIRQSFIPGASASWWNMKKPDHVNSAYRWRNMPDDVFAIADRLQGVQIEQTDAVELIGRWSGEWSTLIYADPPYPKSTRGQGRYVVDNNRQSHARMLSALQHSGCQVAISSYRSALYDSYLTGWRTETRATHVGSAPIAVGQKARKAEEILYLNYAPNGERIA